MAKQMCDGNDEVDSDDESDFEEDERWMPDTPVTVASGDLVLQEAAPFAGILLKSQREKRCHACFRELGKACTYRAAFGWDEYMLSIFCCDLGLM